MRVTIKPDALAQNITAKVVPPPAMKAPLDRSLIKVGDLSSDAARAEYLERVLRLVALISENGCSSLAVDIHRLTQGAITRVSLAKKGAPR